MGGRGEGGGGASWNVFTALMLKKKSQIDHVLYNCSTSNRLKGSSSALWSDWSKPSWDKVAGFLCVATIIQGPFLPFVHKLVLMQPLRLVS